MNKISEFINKIKNRYAYIYKVNDCFYYFGSCVCRKCSVDEIKLYEDLLEENERLKNLCYKTNYKDYNKLKIYFDSIINLGNVEYSDDLYYKMRYSLEEIIEKLSDNEIDNLFQQYRFYEKIMIKCR